MNQQKIQKQKPYRGSHYFNDPKKYYDEWYQRKKNRDKRARERIDKRAKAIWDKTYHNPELYPLMQECELCPENDKRTEKLEHHHPDYAYPFIYVTVCPKCHRWINILND